MNSSNNKPLASREHVVLAAKPKLILSKTLQSQIIYFHSVVGDLEWSGPLFFSIVSGSVEDLPNLIVKAELMLPKDVGTSGYTEYTMGPEVMDFYDKYPQAMGMKMGHIHTHHNMSTFFSGTDMSELYDNAPNHNYYVSLIVNHKGVYAAKVAIAGEVDSNMRYKGTDGSYATQALDKKSLLVTADFSIEFEQDDFMIEEITSLIKRARNKVVAQTKPAVSLNALHSSGPYNNSNSRAKQYYDNRPKPKQPTSTYMNHDLFWEEDESWATRMGRTPSNSEYEFGYPGGAAIEESDNAAFEDEYKDVINFLPLLITLNPNCKDDLDDVIKTLDKRLTGNNLNVYAKQVGNRVLEYYQKYFKPSDIAESVNIYSFILNCSIVLEKYADISNLATALIMEFDDMYDAESDS